MKTVNLGAAFLLAPMLLCRLASYCLAGELDGPMGPWQEQDIGNTGASGTAAVSNAVFTISGSGADIWDPADAFHYVYQAWSGDGAMVLRILHVDETDTHARAGIMFRASIDPASPHAFVFYRAGEETGFEARLDSRHSAWVYASWVGTPYWLKLVRLENAFTAFDSPDGTNWNQIATTNVDMPTNILVGLAVTSHDYGTLCTASLDNLRLVSRPAAPSNVKALRAFDHIAVSWTRNSTNESGFRLEEFVDWGDTNYWIARDVGANVTNFEDSYVPAALVQIQATNLMGSAFSDTATVTDGLLDPIPPQWQRADVGGPIYPGGANFRDDEFRIVEAGSGIGGTFDQFHFVYQKLAGDGEIMGQYPGESLDYFASYDGKGGIMFRQSLDPAAPFIFYYISAGASGQGYEVRRSAGASAETNTISNYLWYYPVMWVRMTRTNNLFTLSIADNNYRWLTIASQHIEMQDPVYVGMAASAGVNYYLQQSSFPQIRFSGQHSAMKAVPMSTNLLGLFANGAIGQSYGLETSTNLRNWSLVAVSVANTNGTIAFTDANIASFRQKFYRTVLLK